MCTWCGGTIPVYRSYISPQIVLGFLKNDNFMHRFFLLYTFNVCVFNLMHILQGVHHAVWLLNFCTWPSTSASIHIRTSSYCSSWTKFHDWFIASRLAFLHYSTWLVLLPIVFWFPRPCCFFSFSFPVLYTTCLPFSGVVTPSFRATIFNMFRVGSNDEIMM